MAGLTPGSPLGGAYRELTQSALTKILKREDPPGAQSPGPQSDRLESLFRYTSKGNSGSSGPNTCLQCPFLME